MRHPNHLTATSFSEHGISRRRFVGIAAMGAIMVTSGVCVRPGPASAATGTVSPKPIPGGINTPWNVAIHHYPPKPGGDLATLDEPSQITDFDGLLTDSRIFGMGMATDTKTGSKTRYPFMADMGIMQGRYIGEDSHEYTGSFGFI